MDNQNNMDNENGFLNADQNKYDMENIDTGRLDEDFSVKKKIVKTRKNGCMFNIIWGVLIIFISVLITRYALSGINDMLAIGREENTVSVEIPEEANLDTVAEALEKSGVIYEKTFFKMYATVTKARRGFSQGTYEMKTNMDYQAILNYIRNQSNRKDVVEVTFREGLSVLECADILEQNEVCDKEEFLKKCNSDEFDKSYQFLASITNKDSRYYKLEGYLFPDSYQFYKGASATDAIKRFLNNYQKRVVKPSNIEGFSENVSIQDMAVQSGKNMEELVTIASIIQAEAANKEDMYKTSSVIYNRLKTLETDGRNVHGEFGLKCLKVDSTIWYPYRTKAMVPDNKVDKFKSTYNTYSIEGLPPGPICNPGIDAFKAAINPMDTDYYYFCHSDSGDAYYARTNDVHELNLKKAGLK